MKGREEEGEGGRGGSYDVRREKRSRDF